MNQIACGFGDWLRAIWRSAACVGMDNIKMNSQNCVTAIPVRLFALVDQPFQAGR